MSLTRVKFRNADNSNEYECVINPITINPQDSSDYKSLPVLDAMPVRSTSAYDARIRTLEWDYFPTSSTAWTGLVSELKTYIGDNKRINLEDIGVPQGLNTWQNIKVMDVQTNMASGQSNSVLRQNMILTYVLR